MNLLDKIKGFFSPFMKNSEEKEIYKINNTDQSMLERIPEVIHINPNVYLAHRAARLCVGKGINNDLNSRMKHLEGIIGVNKHESVAEHTNIIALLKIPKVLIEMAPDDFVELMSNLKYLNAVKGSPNDHKKVYLLIGGSIRGFMHTIRETWYCNYFLGAIKQILYSSCEKCFLKSLIDNELLEENLCTYLPNGEISLVKSNVTQVKNDNEDIDVENYDAECDTIEDPIEVESDHVTVVYMSPINAIYEKVKNYGFTLADVYNVATISFIFHDISRSCSHQLVRHRNAISQESQRYVLQTDKFINPIILNRSDKYSDRRYKEVIEKTDSIINRGFSEYRWLIDHKVAKEDARAFLPTNVVTQIMMTMTYKNYAYFLNLRLDKAAQKEIRNLAEESSFLVLDSSKVQDFISYCITPTSLKKRQIVQEISVDDIIEEEYNPSTMRIDTDEAAEKLLEKQEQYRKIEETEI